jgi:Cu2+-exporting ATPase
MKALFTLVDHNPHPRARSLREAILTTGYNISSNGKARKIEESVGNGVYWQSLNGNIWSLGRHDWKSQNEPFEKNAAYTVLRKNGAAIALFKFADDVRDDAQEAIENLKKLKLKTVILSGDTEERVEVIAGALDLDSTQTEGNLSPEDKAQWIKTNAPNSALMIGDGANDTLAFNEAICRGTPVVEQGLLEDSADFFFFGRSLRSVPELFFIRLRRNRTVTTIFCTTVLYNISAIALCLGGLMHPLLAAILMPLSSIATLSISWIGLGRQSQAR